MAQHSCVTTDERPMTTDDERMNRKGREGREALQVEGLQVR